MITLYLIRHGETDYNRENRVQGMKDSMLTDFGRQQAAAIADHFKNIDLDIIYASPLKRAWDTANAISEASGITEVIPVDEFKELHCGKFEDMLIDEIKECCWDEWTEFLSDPAVPPLGGESMNELFNRVSKATLKVLSEVNDDANVAIVSHAGVVRMGMATLMNVSVKSAVNFGLSNASVAKFINKYDRWTCLGWNDTEHLGKLEGEVKFVL